MVRILFGLTAAAALTFAAPEKADAANWYFGVSSGYGGGFGAHYGAHYRAAPRVYAGRPVIVSPHVYPHRVPHVHSRVYSRRVPSCAVSPYGYGRVHSRRPFGVSPYFRY